MGTETLTWILCQEKRQCILPLPSTVKEMVSSHSQFQAHLQKRKAGARQLEFLGRHQTQYMGISSCVDRLCHAMYPHLRPLWCKMALTEASERLCALPRVTSVSEPKMVPQSPGTLHSYSTRLPANLSLAFRCLNSNACSHSPIINQQEIIYSLREKKSFSACCVFRQL